MTFYVHSQYQPATLLRRVDFVDEAFVAGRWVPTPSIVDYMFGQDDFVEPVSEDEARAMFPAAFAVSAPS